MKEVKFKRKVYAKKIIDLKGIYMIPQEIDRTKEIHRYPYDVDVRSNKSSTPKEKRFWIYWGSHKTIKKCLEKIDNLDYSVLLNYTDIRIVESKTGLVLKKFKV